MESISIATIEQDEAIPEVQATDTRNNGQDNVQGTPLQEVEEIDSSALVKPNPSLTKVAKRDEPTPSPLLGDPYEWEQCTITIRYSLLPDHTVSVSVHNHRDEPIVKTFPEAELSLPGRISSMIAMLRTIWPTSTVSATMALMPKLADATERVVVTSIRAGGDTPIVQTDLEGNVPFPAQINQMLDELKAALPGRALKHIEKSAKTKVTSVTKPATKSPSKVAAKPTITAPTADNKSQLSLF